MTNEKLEDLEKLYKLALLYSRENSTKHFDAENGLELIAGIRLLQSELTEQARLNGMGSEREARLMAQVAKVCAEVGRLTFENQKLRAALEKIEALEPLRERERREIAREALGL